MTMSWITVWKVSGKPLRAPSFCYSKEKEPDVTDSFSMVREKGLEPSRPKAHAPKACVSTNSTTRAHWYVPNYIRPRVNNKGIYFHDACAIIG